MAVMTYGIVVTDPAVVALVGGICADAVDTIWRRFPLVADGREQPPVETVVWYGEGGKPKAWYVEGQLEGVSLLGLLTDQQESVIAVQLTAQARDTNRDMVEANGAKRYVRYRWRESDGELVIAAAGWGTEVDA